MVENYVIDFQFHSRAASLSKLYQNFFPRLLEKLDLRPLKWWLDVNKCKMRQKRDTVRPRHEIDGLMGQIVTMHIFK